MAWGKFFTLRCNTTPIPCNASWGDITATLFSSHTEGWLELFLSSSPKQTFMNWKENAQDKSHCTKLLLLSFPK
eukprot:4309727-Ditylum_brightwellii.AAC.1